MGGATGTVLLVSTHPDRSARIAAPLRERGYTVDVKAGDTAQAHVRAGGVDVVILDIQSSGSNPFQTLKELSVAVSPPPVLVMGSAETVERIGRCLEMGATDSLMEPLEPALIVARIDLLLDCVRLRSQVVQYTQDRQRIAAALATSEKFEADVEIGRQIQASFLPETLPDPKGWEIAARFQPARQVAGDWYDAFPLTHGRIGLVIADVCDKGVGAALFMALMRSLIRAYGQQNYALRLLDVLESGATTRAPGGLRLAGAGAYTGYRAGQARGVRSGCGRTEAGCSRAVRGRSVGGRHGRAGCGVVADSRARGRRQCGTRADHTGWSPGPTAGSGPRNGSLPRSQC